ncbi:MAG: hypothetical protein OYG31_00425 [Candidatus Kaiserbacteria bacterium]|nr:hypothetical protein [Candidatus Kaiserbacteria bacterium]
MKRLHSAIVRAGVFAIPLTTLLMPVHSQDGTPVFDNPIGYNSLEALLLGAFDTLVTVVIIPLVVLSIVIIGFRMVWSGVQGDSGNYAKLHKSFGYALLGLFIVLAVKGILEVIKNTVGALLVSGTVI